MMLSDLPKDLVEEILSRVPTTTLKRLRSTCKQWNAIFNDREFAKSHFNKAARQHLVVMLKNFRVHSISLNLDGIHNNFDPSIKDIGELSRKESHQVDDIIDMIHCNGLLLCITKGNIPMVWNPCTRETKRVEPRRVYEKSNRFAFGYEYRKSCYNYKILKIQHPHRSEINNARDTEIYDFNSNSWRVLDVTQEWSLATRAVSLKGNAYWFSSEYKDGVFNCFLLSFDFSKEKFGAMRVPVESDFHDLVVLSVIGEKKLALLLQRWALEMEIWVTDDDIDPNGNVVSWNQFLAVDMELRFPPGSEMFSRMTSFCIDEYNKVAVVWDTNPDTDQESGEFIRTITVYIVGVDYYREVVIGDHADCWPLMYSYVPSLLQS